MGDRMGGTAGLPVKVNDLNGNESPNGHSEVARPMNSESDGETGD